MNKILVAVICFIFAFCAMPCIAAPPDSPPRAEQAKQNTEIDMPAPAPHFLAIYAQKSCDAPQRAGEYATDNYQNERRSFDVVTRIGITEHYDIGDH